MKLKKVVFHAPVNLVQKIEREKEKSNLTFSQVIRKLINIGLNIGTMQNNKF